MTSAALRLCLQRLPGAVVSLFGGRRGGGRAALLTALAPAFFAAGASHFLAPEARQACRWLCWSGTGTGALRACKT